MQNFFLFHSHPYWALLGYILVEESGVLMPIPGDTILILFGVWSHQGGVAFWPTLLIVLLATAIGSSVLYFLARWLGRSMLDKYGHLLKYIHVTQENVTKFEQWMQRYGAVAIALARVTPGLRTIGTIAAGTMGVPYRTFIVSSFAGTIVWVSAYYSLGYILGRKFADQIDHILSNRLFFLELTLFSIFFTVFVARFIWPWARRRFAF